MLLRNGEIDQRALARAGFTSDDLLEGLRMQNVDALAGARLAMLEGGGKISVVPFKP